MKITVWYRDGDIRTIDVVGPLTVQASPHPESMMDVLHDEGTGWDYWFNKDGSFDGTGIAGPCNDLTSEEAAGIMQGLKEMQEGKTKPFAQIQCKLRKKN